MLWRARFLTFQRQRCRVERYHHSPLANRLLATLLRLIPPATVAWPGSVNIGIERQQVGLLAIQVKLTIGGTLPPRQVRTETPLDRIARVSVVRRGAMPGRYQAVDEALVLLLDTHLQCF